MKIAQVFVFLGAKEYGNDKMRAVADQVAAQLLPPKEFSNQPDRDALLLNVHEHGGWFLQYFYDANNKGKIVGTANDTAQFDGETKALRARLNESNEWESLGEIRRD
jgi:hypothetical protein